MAAEVKTDHPHIVQVKGICGGRPTIKESRIPVWQIVVMFKAGDLPEDILEAYPNLRAAQVYDAISYYLDHQDEIEKEIEENRIENVLRENSLTMDEDGRVHFPEEK